MSESPGKCVHMAINSSRVAVKTTGLPGLTDFSPRHQDMAKKNHIKEIQILLYIANLTVP